MLHPGRQGFSLLLVAVLAGLPVAGSLCAAACAGAAAGAAASAHAHCEAAPGATDTPVVASTAVQHCASHDAAHREEEPGLAHARQDTRAGAKAGLAASAPDPAVLRVHAAGAPAFRYPISPPPRARARLVLRI